MSQFDISIKNLKYFYKNKKPVLDIELLEIDPIHQNKARIQLKDLKIYDEKGTLLYQRDLLLS